MILTSMGLLAIIGNPLREAGIILHFLHKEKSLKFEI